MAHLLQDLKLIKPTKDKPMKRPLKKVEAQRSTLLPEDPLSALKVMSQLTRQMLEFSMEETKCLKKKDLAALLAVQSGKELRVEGYTRACTEFSGRMAEFKGLDEKELGTLEALTIELGKVTRNNQKLMSTLGTSQTNKTHSNNLFLLQGTEAAE
jgi:hypothetical protein